MTPIWKEIIAYCILYMLANGEIPPNPSSAPLKIELINSFSEVKWIGFVPPANCVTLLDPRVSYNTLYTCGCLYWRQNYCVKYNQFFLSLFLWILVNYLSMNIYFATNANDILCVVKYIKPAGIPSKWSFTYKHLLHVLCL